MSEPRSLRAAAVALVLGLLALARPAQAGPDEGRSRLVLLYVAGPDAVVDALAARLAGRLGQRGAILRVQVVPRVGADEALNAPALVGADAALARVWLDAHDPDEASLFLVPASGDRVLARRIALPSGIDEVALAEIVFIVDGAAQTLQASQPIGVPREEARAAMAMREGLETAPAAARPGSTVAFQLGIAGGARSWSSDAPAVPEVSLYVLAESRSPAGRVGIAVDGALRRDVQSDTGDTTVTTSMTAFHLWLSLARPFGGASVGRLMLGPGVTANEASAQSQIGGERIVVGRSSSSLEWTVGALLRWDLTVADRLVLFVAAGADVAPFATRYTADIDGTTTVVLSTWNVRPTALAGIALDLPAL